MYKYYEQRENMFYQFKQIQEEWENEPSTFVSVRHQVSINNEKAIRKWKPIVDILCGDSNNEEETKNKIRKTRLDFLLDDVGNPTINEPEEKKFRTFLSVYAEYYSTYVDETCYSSWNC